MNEQVFVYFITLCLGFLVLISFGIAFVVASFKKSSEIRWHTLKDIMISCESANKAARESERRVQNLQEMMEKEIQTIKIYMLNIELQFQHRQVINPRSRIEPQEEVLEKPVRRTRRRRKLLEQKNPEQ